MKKRTLKRVMRTAFESVSRCGVDDKLADAISGAIIAALIEYDKGEKQPQKAPKEPV